MSAQKLKASEKQDICKKLVTVLKRHYDNEVASPELPVLETVIYGICLENSDYASAATSYEKLHDVFHHDLNEMRVSTVSDLEQAFTKQVESDWRALRVRSLLRHVFEQEYEFSLEGLRRKTLDSASTELAEIPQLSSFVQNYVIQEIVQGHVVPIDRCTRELVVWLGLVEPKETDEEAAVSMKTAVRKADAPQLFHLLHSLATDSAHQKQFARAAEKAPEEGYDPTTAVQRLRVLLGELKEKTSGTGKTTKKTTASKSTKTGTKKSPAKKSTASKSTKTETKKGGTKKKTKKSTSNS